MAVTFQNKNEFAGRVYPFHVEPVKRDVMGYKVADVEKGTVIPQGTPLVANMDDKTAVICKHAKVVKKVSTTKFIVDYVGFLTVGTKIFCSGETTPTLSEISAINKDTKEITLKAANAQLDAGKILVEGESVGSKRNGTSKTRTQPHCRPHAGDDRPRQDRVRYPPSNRYPKRSGLPR